jgi:hypothetical protein
MIMAFIMSKAGRYVIGALAAFALLAAAYAYVDHKGYQRAEAHYTAVINKDRAERAEADANEQRRQTIANNAAKKREAEAIAEIDRLESENTEIRRKMRDEAAKDPDAGRIAISPDGVQRLNSIR